MSSPTNQGIGKDEPLRSRLIHCAHRSRLGRRSFDLRRATRSLAGTASSGWDPPMSSGGYRFAVHAGGRGLTTAKQRVLASGGLPIFAEQLVATPLSSSSSSSSSSPSSPSSLSGEASTSAPPYAVDAYYGRFLRRNYHYVALRSGSGSGSGGGGRGGGGGGGGGSGANSTSTDAGAAPPNLCEDLERVVEWGRKNGDAAAAIGMHARRFASTVWVTDQKTCKS
jgi:hypothetical protein